MPSPATKMTNTQPRPPPPLPRRRKALGTRRVPPPPPPLPSSARIPPSHAQPVPVTPLHQPPVPQHDLHPTDHSGIRQRSRRPPPPPPPRGQHKKRSATNSSIGRRRPPPPPPPPRGQHKKRSATNSSIGRSIIINNKRPRYGSSSSSSFSSCRNLRDVYQTGEKIGQGTFGCVFIATHKPTNQQWALKRVSDDAQGEGISLTTLREVKLLTKLQHPNIVKLKEVVSSSKAAEANQQSDAEEGGDSASADICHYDFFLVLEYFEYDLAGILYTPEIQYSLDHLRSWSYQLLRGVSYLHQQYILHRDLKPANLLVNRCTGVLKIADFGLAISTTTTTTNGTTTNISSNHGSAKCNTTMMIPLTCMVQSLWYRAPELLLECYKYDNKIDMYSVGCILAELICCRRPLFTGVDETNQLELIWNVLGGQQQQQRQTNPCWPTKESCRKTPPPLPKNHHDPKKNLVQLLHRVLPSRSHLQWMHENDSAAVDMITQLLQVNPSQRYSAQDALRSDFFRHGRQIKAAPRHELDMTSGSFATFKTIHDQDIRNRGRHKQQQQQHKPRNAGTTTTATAASVTQQQRRRQQQHKRNAGTTPTVAAASVAQQQRRRGQQQQQHKRNASTTTTVIAASAAQQQQHKRNASTTTTVAAAASVVAQQKKSGGKEKTKPTTTTTTTETKYFDLYWFGGKRCCCC